MQVDEEEVEKRVREVLCKAKKDAERVLDRMSSNEYGRPDKMSTEMKVFIDRWYLMNEIRLIEERRNDKNRMKGRFVDWAEKEWIGRMGEKEWNRKVEVLEGMRGKASEEEREEIDWVLECLSMPNTYVRHWFVSKFNAVNDGRMHEATVTQRESYETRTGQCWFCGERSHTGKKCLMLKWAYLARGEPKNDEDPYTLEDERDMVRNRGEADAIMKKRGYSMME